MSWNCHASAKTYALPRGTWRQELFHGVADRVETVAGSRKRALSGGGHALTHHGGPILDDDDLHIVVHGLASEVPTVGRDVVVRVPRIHVESVVEACRAWSRQTSASW
jgi:hypothetical protein